MSDARAAAARQAHLDVETLGVQAARARDRRDSIVRALRAEDPKRWSYGALARAVGCSPELIAKIIKVPPAGDAGHVPNTSARH